MAKDRPFDNVTEWCKKKLYWERVESLKVALLPLFQAELVDRNELMAAKKDAKKLQKTDDGIAGQTEVVRLGPKYWQQLMCWAEKKNMLTPDENKLVAIAARMPNSMPNPFQSARLLEIHTKVVGEGFQTP